MEKDKKIAVMTDSGLEYAIADDKKDVQYSISGNQSKKWFANRMSGNDRGFIFHLKISRFPKNYINQSPMVLDHYGS